MSTARKSLRSPRITCEITQEIIDKAVPKDSGHCMIADAVRAAVPTATHISVDLATIRFSDPAAGRRYIYLTPRFGQKALLDFDAGVKPEPFNIRLHLAHVVPTGTGRKGKTTLEPTQTRPGHGVDEHGVPIRSGGQTPPLGPLPGGAPGRGSEKAKVPGAGPGNRTGKRREFGLRAIIR